MWKYCESRTQGVLSIQLTTRHQILFHDVDALHVESPFRKLEMKDIEFTRDRIVLRFIMGCGFESKESISNSPLQKQLFKGLCTLIPTPIRLSITHYVIDIMLHSGEGKRATMLYRDHFVARLLFDQHTKQSNMNVQLFQLAPR